MPGLLETPPLHFGSIKYVSAVLAEFFGSMMFALIGGSALYVATGPLAPPPNVVMAAFANGLALMIVSKSAVHFPKRHG
jgi:glycerol uptake facilitator-like aquaporin